ncbi:MAG: cobalamin-binding protein [Xanthomonadaceae bacterium]|nr:cobalamin-binding protein [Xanthomonadaceae bacterium]
MLRTLAWLMLCSLATISVAAERAQVRIVSLAPSLTELAFAAGAGDRIVATVEYSDYPQAARAIPRIGDAFRVDLERVLELRPDFVLAWESGTPAATIERLRALGLNVEIVSTQTLAEVSAALRHLGELAGTRSAADAAAKRFESQIARLREEYRDRKPVSVFVQINDRPLYTVNGNHIISEIAALCGGTNVFAALRDLAPTIGIEAVIAANPDAIVSTDSSVTDAMAHWRRWETLTAVRARNVFTLPSDELARATPRLVTGARSMCRALETARENLRRTASGLSRP